MHARQFSFRRHAASLICAAVAIVACAASPAAADDYPTRPVTFVTPAAAGNSPDVATRFIADRLGAIWKQQIVVMNKPGAGGLLAAQAASTVTPDGYTLYMTQASTFTVLPITQAEKAGPLLKTFVPIALIAEQPIAVSVSPKVPVKTVAELIDYIKKQPQTVQFAASNRGGQSHLTGEYFARKAGVKMVYIHGPSAATSVTDVAAGRIPVMFEGIAGVAGAMQGGSVRVIGVGSGKRLSNYPDIPTIGETVPGFESQGWIMLMAPAGTPDAIVQKVAKDLRSIVEQPDVAKKFATIGTYPHWLGPADSAAYIKKQEAQWWPLVREVGVKR
jgi:tripartite-type tricarboxylate transporter receptor subunit TctC